MMNDAPERIWRVKPWIPSQHVHGLASWPDQHSAGDGATEYRRADLPPKVKPLVWHQIETHGGRVWDAIALHTDYRIIKKISGGYWLTHPDCTLPTLEAAKAAAQADYERRILSALEGYSPRNPA